MIKTSLPFSGRKGESISQIADFLLAKKVGELCVGERSKPTVMSEAVKDKVLVLFGSMVA